MKAQSGGVARQGREVLERDADPQINDLTTFIRGPNAGPVHLVAWSMSGDAVLTVALRNPESAVLQMLQGWIA